MDTQPTPRFTLPDPNRPQAPALPAELLIAILKRAQAGRPLSEQFKTRLTFERKSRTSAKAGGGIAPVEDIAGRIEKIRLSLTEAEVFEGDAMLAKLFTQLFGATWVSFGLSPFSMNEIDADCLGPKLMRALAKLTSIKHFEVEGVNQYEYATVISQPMLLKLVPRWPKLKSLTLKNCYAGSDASSVKLFASSRSFESAHFDDAADSSSWLLASLPPSTRTVKVEDYNIFSKHMFDPFPQLDSNRLDLAKGLTRLELKGGPTRIAHSHMRELTAARGGLDNFTANLDNCTHLTISPVAISDLASLAKLPKLTHLELPIGYAVPATAVKSTELVQLITQSNSLKRVAFPDWARQKWTVQEIALVDGAARNKIELSWI